MKKVMMIGVLWTVCAATVHAQSGPVSWSTRVVKLDAKRFEVHVTATIAAGWHLYSQTTPAGGPRPTVVTLQPNPILTGTGKFQEAGDMHQKNEPLFGVDVRYFDREVDFVQTVTRKASVKTAVSGQVVYMVCNDRECLPPRTESFSIPIPK